MYTAGTYCPGTTSNWLQRKEKKHMNTVAFADNKVSFLLSAGKETAASCCCTLLQVVPRKFDLSGVCYAGRQKEEV